jgi:hypothetical protein
MIDFQGAWPPDPDTVTFSAGYAERLNDQILPDYSRTVARGLGAAVGSLLNANLGPWEGEDGIRAASIIATLTNQIDSEANRTGFAEMARLAARGETPQGDVV